MRIKSSALDIPNKISFFEGSPFTGDVVFLNEGIVSQCIRYESGLARELEDTECFLSSSSSVILDKDVLSSNGGVEPFYYKEHKFNGLALDFDEQYCVGELLINNGLVEQEISCYRSGNLGSFEGYYNNTEENIYWYPDGKLKEESLVFNEKYRGIFSFDDKGLLTAAIIENDYFMILNEMKSHLRYCQLLNSTCFKNINTANYTFLSGEGVDNHFIKALAESNGLSGTNKLSLDNCSFDLKNYLLIGQLENLKTLSVKDQRIGISHILKKVKVSRPELLITFNKHELTTY